MVAITQAVSQLLALASLTSALHINFRRFSTDTCGDEHHIRQTTDMHEQACKTFSDHEPVFHAFDWSVKKEGHDIDNLDCSIIVYAGKDCHGPSTTYGDMKTMPQHACHPTKLDGRSAYLKCANKIEPPVKVLSEKPTPTKVSTTVTTTESTWPDVTLTVVPQKPRHKVCYYEDEE